MNRPFRTQPNKQTAQVKNRASAYSNAVCRTVVSNVALYATFVLDIVFLALIVRGGYTRVVLSFFCVAFALECLMLLLLLPVPVLQAGVVKRNIFICIFFAFASIIEIAWAGSMASYGGGGVFGTFAAARTLLWLCAFVLARWGKGSVPVLLLGITMALVALFGANAAFGFSFSSRPLRFEYSEGTDNYGEGYVVTSMMYSTRNNVKIPATYKGKPVVAVQTGNGSVASMRDLTLPASVRFVQMSATHLERLTVQGNDVRFSNDLFYCPELRKITFAGNELPAVLPDLYMVAEIAVPRDKMDEALARADFAAYRERVVPAVNDDEGYIVYFTDFTQPEDHAAQELFIQPTRILQGNGTFTLPAPDLTSLGYAFDGWYTSRDYLDKVQSVSAHGGYKLYARYYRLYTVELYASRYDDTPADSFVYHYGNFDNGNTVPLPTGGKWEKDGYYFAGWFEKEQSAVEGCNTEALRYGSVGNKKFYAEYKKLYSITVHDNGGTGYGNVPAYFHEWTHGFDIDDAKKAGYTFMGWYFDAAYTEPLWGLPPVDDFGYVVQNDVDVYAKFNKNYTITYMLGYTMPSDAPTSYHYDSNALKLPTPARRGYRFMGWYTNVMYTGGRLDYVPNHEQKDLVFYAKWEPITYTVRYDKGDYWDPTGSVPDGKFTYNEQDTLAMCTFEKTGFSFVGWKINDVIYDEGQTGVFNFAEINGAVVIASAQWRAHEFTLVFDADCDDATGEMSDRHCSYMEYITMPPCGFTREGYYFLFWSIRGTILREGELTCMSWTDMQEDGAVIAVYAVWKKVQEE